MKVAEKKMGVKTKIFWIWVAAEMVVLPFSIPATAQIVERIVLAFPPQISAVQLPVHKPGVSQFVVASNAPFNIISEGAIGDMEITITVSGKINSTPYGAAAQSPGADTACATSISPAQSVIYTADRKTAAKRGQVLEQAVMVEVKYDKALEPKLTFEALNSENSASAQSALSCSSIAS
jgi:hypothetical protein